MPKQALNDEERKKITKNQSGIEREDDKKKTTRNSSELKKICCCCFLRLLLCLPNFFFLHFNVENCFSFLRFFFSSFCLKLQITMHIWLPHCQQRWSSSHAIR